MPNSFIKAMVVSSCIACACSISVLAEEIDLSSMSMENLVQLRTDLNMEIANRGGDNIIPEGVYETGVDIKTGSYDLSVYSSGENFIGVCVYQTNDDYINNNDEHEYYSLDAEKSDSLCRINLTEGNILLIKYGSCIIQESNSSFWQP